MGDERRHSSGDAPAGTLGCSDLETHFKRLPHLSGTFCSRADLHRSHLHGNLTPRLPVHGSRSELRRASSGFSGWRQIWRLNPVSPAALTQGKVLFTLPLIGDLGSQIAGISAFISPRHLAPRCLISVTAVMRAQGEKWQPSFFGVHVLPLSCKTHYM